jgi:hypothetical protein
VEDVAEAVMVEIDTGRSRVVRRRREAVEHRRIGCRRRERLTELEDEVERERRTPQEIEGENRGEER